MQRRGCVLVSQGNRARGDGKNRANRWKVYVTRGGILYWKGDGVGGTGGVELILISRGYVCRAIAFAFEKSNGLLEFFILDA